MLPPYNQPPITIHTPASCTANIPPLNLSLVADRDTDSVALSQVFQCRANHAPWLAGPGSPGLSDYPHR
ncbi:hypothetical protein LMH87_010905 [Akanthomyces muscarius]|uniref:Uncharacterized protein n=1 Tax=Akanthomyces muscarius TaxID=2231603 RepID=A0A9W8UKK5_AKAMU|nr:hypothetical protein LMH87_010905 [Akanthomyces muscarius]KAJ4150140.1 hypothetical protein LMH87_010905 [Akanthomyces muscarius]